LIAIAHSDLGLHRFGGVEGGSTAASASHMRPDKGLQRLWGAATRMPTRQRESVDIVQPGVVVWLERPGYPTSF
jgi:hypothetical protein